MDQEHTINNTQRVTGKIGRGRLYSFLILLIAGVILVIYGSLRSISFSGSEEKANQAVFSEIELNKGIAVGGITRSETGEIKKTYQEGEKPAQACPT